MRRNYHLMSRSPLHHSALRLKDLHPGRKIICCNTITGEIRPYTIVGRPFICRLGVPKEIEDYYQATFQRVPTNLSINLRDDSKMGSRSGQTWPHSLADMGIIPFTDDPSSWSPFSFTLDAHKVHLLRLSSPYAR
jgi:hypothetical protein